MRPPPQIADFHQRKFTGHQATDDKLPGKICLILNSRLSFQRLFPGARTGRPVLGFAAGICCALLAWTGASSAAQEAVAPTSPPSPWRDLFAADLSDAQFPAGVWTVENGELTASEDQVIWTRDDHSDFALDFEFKTGPDANSGVLVYATDTAQWVKNSVEIQLLDDAGPKWAKIDPKWRCGAIFGCLAPSKSAVKPAGQWNHCTITCRGRRIEVVLNGEKVTSMDMSRWTSPTHNPDGSAKPPWLSTPFSTHPTRGKIGFQGKHGGSPVRFRNIKIRDLACSEGKD